MCRSSAKSTAKSTALSEIGPIGEAGIGGGGGLLAGKSEGGGRRAGGTEGNRLITGGPEGAGLITGTCVFCLFTGIIFCGTVGGPTFRGRCHGASALSGIM